ncbi:MAG: hypothetical protein JST70_12920 [Bacteroidetes bacterium]|nr:hypothetical protein [Bacteroidota bacterium]
MKHILIPTDFSIPSLNAVHSAMAVFNDAPVRITLFNLLRMPDELPGIIFRAMRSKHYSLITDDFKEGCEILENRYGASLHSLKVKFAFGNTVSYLRNWLDGEQVTDILICPDIPLGLPSSKSIAMVPLLKNTGYNIVSISSKARYQSLDTTTISMLRERGIRLLKQETENYAAKK